MKKTKEQNFDLKIKEEQKNIHSIYFQHKSATISRAANHGITLVALVVTIVILLILAGITLTYVFGDNGIIKLAKQAKNETEAGIGKEQDDLGTLANMLKEEYGNNEGSGNNSGSGNNEGDGSGDGNEDIVKPPEPPKEEIEETTAFSRANGVIDIVWLNMDNTVRTESQGPISPASYLGGLTAIKYDGTNWVEADATNAGNSWYNYIAQTGNTDGKTSNWANARSSDKNAYFVWIPRYAYKITYFNSPENADAYRANNKSTEGIIGYSNINGIIDVSTGTEKLVKDSEPSNVTETVKSSGYADYIPHPAFEFDGAKAGIWVGKFESCGTTDEVVILPNSKSLRDLTVTQALDATRGWFLSSGLSGDGHLLKNTEWGAVAYLAESKYGRNGTEISMSDAYLVTGGGDYASNVSQSSTGNIYGIYGLSGGPAELVMGVLQGYLTNGRYYDFSTIDSKYYNTYPYLYNDCKKIKGDAVYETSESRDGHSAWHSDSSMYPYAVSPIFSRRFRRSQDKLPWCFLFPVVSEGSGDYYGSFRIALIS